MYEGVDLVLSRAEERSIAQCKRFRGQVGQSVIRDFFGAVVHEKAKRGFVVTTGTFSLPAQSWALDKNLILVDGVDLLSVLSEQRIEFEVPVVANSAAAISPFTQLRNAIDAGNLLRMIILGPPPPENSFQQIAAALQAILSLPRDRVHWIDVGALSPLKPLDLIAKVTNVSNDDLVFLEDVQKRDLPRVVEAASSNVEITLGRGSRSRTVSLTLPQVHICATVWDTRTIQSLTTRHRRQLLDTLSIQIRSDQLYWSEPHAILGPDQR